MDRLKTNKDPVHDRVMDREEHKLSDRKKDRVMRIKHSLLEDRPKETVSQATAVIPAARV